MCENGYKTGFTHYTIIENFEISEFLKNFEGQVDIAVRTLRILERMKKGVIYTAVHLRTLNTIKTTKPTWFSTFLIHLEKKSRKR